MNELELILVCGIIIIGASYLGVYLRLIKERKRFKEKLSQLGTHQVSNFFDGFSPSTTLRERYGGVLEEKEDFLPKKKMKYHTLEEPIEEYGGAPFSNNCYDTTDYEYPF